MLLLLFIRYDLKSTNPCDIEWFEAFLVTPLSPGTFPHTRGRCYVFVFLYLLYSELFESFIARSSILWCARVWDNASWLHLPLSHDSLMYLNAIKCIQVPCIHMKNSKLFNTLACSLCPRQYNHSSFRWQTNSGWMQTSFVTKHKRFSLALKLQDAPHGRQTKVEAQKHGQSLCGRDNVTIPEQRRNLSLKFMGPPSLSVFCVQSFLLNISLPLEFPANRSFHHFPYWSTSCINCMPTWKRHQVERATIIQ